MSFQQCEETFHCKQCSDCPVKKKKFPIITIKEEEEMTIKDGVPVKTTKITRTTRTKDGVPVKTTRTMKDGVVQTTTKDGVPTKTTTKYWVPTNDEAPAKIKAPKDEVQAKTATKEQGRGGFLDSARVLLLTSFSFYFVYKGLDALL